MRAPVIPSAPIADIDISKCYFNPGCGLEIYKSGSNPKLMKLLHEYFGDVKSHAICCRHEPQLENGSVIINNCAGCDRRFRSLYDGISTVTIWEVLDSIAGLPLPDYSGEMISVHDSCSFRQKPQVHAAVRSLLRKMNFEIIESEHSGRLSVCCGSNLYGHVSNEVMFDFMKTRAAQMPMEQVAVYCTACINAMTIGGKKPRHMVDLVLGEETFAPNTDIDEFTKTLWKYIEAH